MRSARNSIFLIVAILSAIGVVMIYSASAIYAEEKMGDSLYFLKRHLIYFVIGLGMMVLAMGVNINTLKRLSKPMIISAILLLALVLVPHIGRETAGARRWFKWGPFNFQPSEFAKVAVIIYIADIMSRKEGSVKSFLHGYLPPIMVLGLVAGLILPYLVKLYATALKNALILARKKVGNEPGGCYFDSADLA